MKKLVSVKPIAPFQLWLCFDDGVEGTVDLSYLKGKGIFTAFDNPSFFESVKIDSQSRALVWDNEIDLCADSLYLNVCNRNSEPRLHQNA
jgi:hypothetical protein